MSSSDETTTGTGDACISAEDLERARRDITSRGMLLSRQDSLSLIHEIEHLKRLVGTGRALFDAQAEQVGALITERNELRSLLVDRSPLFQDLEDAKAENARIRERVAELEEQAEQSDWRVLKLTDVLADAVLLIHETRHDGAPAECAERICEIGKQLVQAARDSVVDNLAAALAQADETGGAR